MLLSGSNDHKVGFLRMQTHAILFTPDRDLGDTFCSLTSISFSVFSLVPRDESSAESF